MAGDRLVGDRWHGAQPILEAGRRLDESKAAVVLVHGRGATAQSVLALADALNRPHLAFLVPQAAQDTWYPESFLSPLERNEPWLSSALRLLGSTVDRITAHGIVAEHILLLGFSQGACLALEFGARHARRWGGLAGLSGGLIGPPGTPRDYAGGFDTAPVFLGCSDHDPHVPEWRVHETAEVLARLGAEVSTRIYPGLGHTVNEDELAAVRSMVDALDHSRTGA